MRIFSPSFCRLNCGREKLRALYYAKFHLEKIKNKNGLNWARLDVYDCKQADNSILQPGFKIRK